MLTDGNATASQPGGGLQPIPPQEIYKVAEEGQKELPKKAHLHVIYYLNGKEKSGRGRHAARVGEPEQRQVPKGGSQRAKEVAPA